MNATERAEKIKELVALVDKAESLFNDLYYDTHPDDNDNDDDDWYDLSDGDCHSHWEIIRENIPNN